MNPIKVAVQGVQGRMGQVILNSLCQEQDIQVVGATELQVTEDHLPLPDGSGAIPLSSNLESILTTCQPDVLIDFTTAKTIMSTAGTSAERGVNLVIGTTGLTADNLSEIEQLATSHKVGIVVAANFSLGAVMLMHLAKIAGKYFDYAEIIELHHHLKLDSPSGTALTTARAMAQTRGKPFQQPPAQGQISGSRGETLEGISLHSVRLPGFMAHQEVIMGALGQTLSIRHDTINRECYMPGILLAIKEVMKRKEFIYGLDNLLDL